MTRLSELHLLVCSDPHGSDEALDVLEKAAAESSFDALVMCGDFTTFGTTDYTRKFLERFKLRIVAVPGNCDIPETVPLLEQFNASVHNARVELKGWRFFGFGGSLPGGGMPFEVEEDIIERSLRSVAVAGGIMVTHCPAYGMNDLTRGGRHLGSKGILRVVNEFKPVLALSGHVHEARGRVLSKDTVFVNPGSSRRGHYASIRLGEDIEVKMHDVPVKRI